MSNPYQCLELFEFPVEPRQACFFSMKGQKEETIAYRDVSGNLVVVFLRQ